MALPPPGNDRTAIVTGASLGIGEQFAWVLSAVVVPGRVNRVASALFGVAPPELLLPVLARGHPALKRD